MSYLKRIVNNKRIVSKTPMLTVFLLEGANVSQIWRMWSEHTARGQSLEAWILVNIALILWANFYRVVTPNEKWAIWSTYIGIAINFCVIFSVVYFRWIGAA